MVNPLEERECALPEDLQVSKEILIARNYVSRSTEIRVTDAVVRITIETSFENNGDP